LTAHRMPRLTADVAEEKDLGKVEKHRKGEGPDRRPYRRLILIFTARLNRLIRHCARPRADIYPLSHLCAADYLHELYRMRRKIDS
jgi:hypothetical protein